MTGVVSAWLFESDQFDRVTAFLRYRGLLGPTRAVMAIVVVSASLIPLSLMLPSPGRTAASFVVGVAGAALCAVMTWFWSTRWPSRRLSLVAALLGSACAAVWSVTQPSPAMAALACVTLTVTGAYIAFFHYFRVVLLNACLAAGVAVVAAVRLVHDLGTAAGVAAFWILWLPNSAIPLGVRCLTSALTHFAIRSDEDPLTGLLNRRGFGELIARHLLVEVRSSPTARLQVIMIDLDDFKRVNDTRGHAEGDRILLKVAELLRAQFPPGSALCRCGGEEFLIALAATRDVEATESLCAAIRSQCGGVTASVGVASAEAEEIRSATPGQLTEILIDAADHAMYEAKRRGGDRVHRAPMHRRA